MAASSLSLVNQKLAFCRALMHLLQEQPEKRGANEHLRYQSLLDAAAFHLLCAYRHYLRELAENYSVADARYIATEDDLMEVFRRQGKDPVEARELKNLSSDPESWLSELQVSFNTCWQPADQRAEQRIPVLDLDAPEPRFKVVSWDRLQYWYSAFNELIDRQRDTSTEC